MLFLLKEILKGKSFARALFNTELSAFSIQGRVLDVGGGKHQDYLEFLYMGMGDNVSVDTVDITLRGQNGQSVDFEKNPLPFGEATFNQVLAFNVFEHIYNYHFLMSEVRRVLKGKGQLIGFVPFLVNYHPDPHDYFRYTKQALQKILESNGFHNVQVREVGKGPFAVNYNNLMLFLPLIMRVIVLPFSYFADTLFLLLRPKVCEQYPLGYIFIGQK